jgi:hypothetical protein
VGVTIGDAAKYGMGRHCNPQGFGETNTIEIWMKIPPDIPNSVDLSA